MRKEMNKIPVLPLRGVTIFPEMVMYFDVGREKSIKALEEAMKDEGLVLAITQKDAEVDEPESEDLYTIGTVVQIRQMTKVGDQKYKVFVKGTTRAKLLELMAGDYLSAHIEVIKEEVPDRTLTVKALIRSVKELFHQYATLNTKISEEVSYGILHLEDPVELVDMIVGHLAVDTDCKQEVLSCLDVEERLYLAVEILTDEVALMQTQKEILTKVKQSIDKTQKEYFLREQIRVIQEELGDQYGIEEDIANYLHQMSEQDLPAVVKEKLEKEIRRLKSLSPQSPELGSLKSYIETVLSLPWNQRAQAQIEIKRAARLLDEAHYGLSKVKERILEYLAVSRLSDQVMPPILCLVGPPGVGKTSIAKSVAQAAGREYVRISLGGVRDEAEIRGHRRTYIGAMPGRFIKALSNVETTDPVMLLDEIDKMASDFKGDPAAALLELLDSSQNNAFRDHYLELPVDLSQVMFIATANDIGGIPRPLLDRMEIIEVSSYTVPEKLQIAQKYLLPAQLEKHHLTKQQVKLSKRNLQFMIEHYTKEAGVRGLQRTLGAICRKAAKEMAEEETQYVVVNATKLKDYLGLPIFEYEARNQQAEIGIVRGLAWTSVGGDTLSVEVNGMKGKGELKLTGQMGDVMKESALAAMSYIRSQCKALGIDENFYQEQDMHIHIPEGAVPKDGPSAGITMASAMISALTGTPVKPNVAMTGEITIRGRVLPIGGLREKLLAAKRAGIDTVIVPHKNKRHVEALEESVTADLQIIFARTMDEVMRHIFVDEEEYKEK